MPKRHIAVISGGLMLRGRGMTGRVVGFILALCLLAFAGEAKAWTPFGTTENIVPIEDVGLTTPGGDALYLAHKTSTIYFILGVFVSDDGYVLGLRSNPKHYVDMPPPDMLANFQKQGQLPNPLPSYRLGISDYLVGFSLWIVLVPIVVAYAAARIALRSRHRRRRVARY